MMHMKELTFYLITSFSLFLLIPMSLKAGTDAIPIRMTSDTAIKSTETNTADVRLNEIKAMDNSSLGSSERKELRKEIRSIRSEGKGMDEANYVEGGHGGVYISVGAAILIVLLLLILI